MAANRLAVICSAVLATATAASAAPAYHVVDRIAGPDGRWDYVQVDQKSNRVLVAQGASVTSVDLATGKATGGLAPGVGLHDALPVNGSEMLVTNGGSGTAVFADEATGATVASVKVGKNPDAAAFDPRSGLVLVMNHSGGDVTLIDAKTHRAVATIVIGGDLEAAVVDGAGKAFVNVEDKNQIAVLDLAGRKVVARYALTGCDGPTGLAYDAADRMLIAACDGATALVDARTGKVLQTLPTGRGADGVVYDAARKLAFVPAGRDGTLAVVAIARGKSAIVQTVKTELGARTIALDGRSGRVYMPAAHYGPPATPGGRPSVAAGTFHLLVVGP